MLKRLGVRVHANDNLHLAAVLARGILQVSDEPEFRALTAMIDTLPFDGAELFATPYDRVLAHLNSLPGVEGFFFNEYAPEGSRARGTERRYFTSVNATKIDAIRAQIAKWHEVGQLSDAEHSLLLGDLIRATNRVANIAGTYGCFIKHWDDRALKPIRLTRNAIIGGTTDHRITCEDALAIARDYTFDAAYLDPPYTWRHYGAYYHVLETIARGDEPSVSGRTGLRPWHDTKSRYCDRDDAQHALTDLINAIQAEHIFLSYNSEGLIEHERIMEILSTRGRPKVREMEFPRYRSNSGTRDQKGVLRERLYYVCVSR